jgi:hypothetical protein
MTGPDRRGMAQVFPRYTNTLSRVTAVAAFGLVVAGLWLWSRIQQSPYTTDVRIAKTQPVPFSHRHHAGELGIDCRYCHTSVERAAFAGIPSTEICMNCHRQIWADSPMLAAVRDSYQNDVPLEWSRVHDLPDFVYFDHSIHVHKGVGCVSCHGQVELMPLTWSVEALTMKFCLDCHRNPAPHLRPPTAIFDMAWERPEDAALSGEQLAVAHQVENLQSCSYCHR